jgi:hypothetical protein
MLWSPENHGRFTRLNNESLLHNIYARGQVSDKAQVMRDKDNRQFSVGLEPPEEVEKLRLG